MLDRLNENKHLTDLQGHIGTEGGLKDSSADDRTRVHSITTGRLRESENMF